MVSGHICSPENQHSFYSRSLSKSMCESRTVSEAGSEREGVGEVSQSKFPCGAFCSTQLSTDWVREVHTREMIWFPQLTNSNVNLIQKHPHKTPGIMFNQIFGHEVKLTHRIKPSQSVFVISSIHLQNSSTKHNV